MKKGRLSLLYFYKIIQIFFNPNPALAINERLHFRIQFLMSYALKGLVKEIENILQGPQLEDSKEKVSILKTKKRGRPRKINIETEDIKKNEKQKRGRGRPRKIKIEMEDTKEKISILKTKKRGRPRKIK